MNGILFRDFPEFFSKYELRNTQHLAVRFSAKLAIYLIELPKFQVAADRLSSALERWCYLLRHGEGLDSDA